MPETYVHMVLTARPRKLQSEMNSIKMSVETGNGGGMPCQGRYCHSICLPSIGCNGFFYEGIQVSWNTFQTSGGT